MFDKLREYGIVPVVAVDTVDHGLQLCEALLEGGLPVAEITFRTDAAEATIRAAAKQFPEIILGAGTVLNVENLKRAIDAGARFAVAPGCNPTVVSAAMEQNFPFTPGICTPSDLEQAVQLGAKLLKFFPAKAIGGPAFLKSLIGPYGHLGVEFCPTGGISQDNMMDYLAFPEVAFVGGSWVAKKDMIRDEQWDTISSLAKAAVAAAKQR